MQTRDIQELNLIMQQKNTLWRAQMEVTNRCNEDCIHCLKDTDYTDELTFDEVKNIFHQLKEEGCIELILSGGEPFVRKDFWDILALTKTIGIGTIIKTNGLNINRDNIHRLIERNPLYLQFSVYGATHFTHDRITNVKGSFVKTMQAINLCERYKIPFKIAVLCFNKNFHELYDLKIMAKKKGWDIGFYFVLMPEVSGGQAPLNLRVTDEQLKEAFKKRLLVWGATGSNPKYLNNSIYHILKDYGRSTIHISAKGKAYVSVNLRMEVGDLRRQSLHDIWQNSPTLRWIRGLTEEDFECSSCEYNNICTGRRPDLAFLEHGDLRTRPLEICRMNKVYHEYLSQQKC